MFQKNSVKKIKKKSYVYLPSLPATLVRMEVGEEIMLEMNDRYRPDNFRQAVSNVNKANASKCPAGETLPMFTASLSGVESGYMRIRRNW